jgi:hypothetical protein
MLKPAEGCAASGIYTLAFTDRFGAVDAAFAEGTLTVTPTDGEGSEPVVAFDLEYEIQEHKYDNYGNPEDVKYGRESCTTNYFIAAGIVDGIVADSGAEVPARAASHVGSAIGRINKIESTEPIEGCTEADFEEGSADFCTFTCSSNYQVTTIDNMMVFSPQRTFVSQACICHNGMGFQVGSTEAFEHAMVSFSNDASSMCTSNFNGVITEAKDVDNALSLTFTFSTGQVCTYAYEIENGNVFGAASAGTHDGAASKSAIIMAIVASIGLLLAFFVPSCFKSEARTYNAVP